MRIVIPVYSDHKVSVIQAEALHQILRDAGYNSLLLYCPTIRFNNSVVQGFNPDIVIAINLTRLDCPVDKKIKFITWKQDSCGNINHQSIAERWNELDHDFIFGFTNDLIQYGFRADRLLEFSMLVNPAKFYPVEGKKDLKVFFSGGRGAFPESYCYNQVEKFGCEISVIKKFARNLEEYYEEGGTVINFQELDDFIERLPEVKSSLEALPERDRDIIKHQYMYWRVNECVYRRTVMRWLKELKVKFKIAGWDWDTNFEFKKHALGWQNDLNPLYNSAEYCLHLNSFEGYHFRPWEIICSGGKVLTRKRNSYCKIMLSNKKFIFFQRKLVIDMIEHFTNGSPWHKEYLFTYGLPPMETFNSKEKLKEILS